MPLQWFNNLQRKSNSFVFGIIGGTELRVLQFALETIGNIRVRPVI